MQSFNWNIEIKIESYGSLTYLVLLYRFLFKHRNYKEVIRHSLELNNNKIYYKNGNATMWIIDSSNFSRFEELKSIKQNNYSDGYAVLLHTKNNDIYSIECNLTSEDFNQMARTISAEWCNV